MLTCLYVSPHLDDVAFSCAGGLLSRVAAGQRVVVCTVFSAGAATREYRLRRREDQRALESAGAEWIHLDLEDAPSRERLTPSFEALVLDAPVRPPVVRQVRGALREVVRRWSPDEIWLPLGIGGHVDHRTVFAARDAAGSRVRYYEDRPYAFVPAFRTLRRLELCGGRLRALPTVASLERRIDSGACGRLLLAGERGRCVAALRARLARAHAPRADARWRSRAVHYPAASLTRATALIGAYRSQVRWLFGATPVTEIWSRHAGASGGGWFEREVRLS